VTATVDHLFMVVTDLVRSVAFYTGLGLLAHDWGGGYVRLHGPDGTFIGMEERPAAEVQPGGIELVIRVDDVHARHAELAAAGVAFESPPEPQEWGAVHAWLRDPDGYRLSIFTPGT
jgi:catechol 2,3-dioxygenase-like lactoylglutathione lyase family enzyme